METDNLIGAIKLWSGNWVPDGWLLCNGQMIPVADQEYSNLYSVIGNIYGGDGRTSFALPDLSGRVAMGETSHLGATGGQESVSLTTNQIPQHRHTIVISGAEATDKLAPKSLIANPVASTGRSNAPVNGFNTEVPNQKLNGMMIAPQGSSEPHNNMQPFLVLRFIICYKGIFPQGN
ncbi:MAG: phage tail protein [Bacteroidetes bacterium]|nr:MAG: phage tail protein [Bacteroidota bacterium]